MQSLHVELKAAIQSDPRDGANKPSTDRKEILEENIYLEQVVTTLSVEIKCKGTWNDIL